MKKLLTFAAVGAAAAAAAAFAPTMAQAGTISFADYASDNEGGIINDNGFIDFGGVGIRFDSGLNLTVAPNSFTRTRNYNPYFDDIAGGKPAGLGVCRVLDGAAGDGAPGAECLDSGDDSIDGEGGIDEMIALFFENPFDLLALSFRDGDHNDINGSAGQVEYSILAGGATVEGITTFADLVSRAIAGEFKGAVWLVLGYVDTEFYLESISDVPIPAALPLLLSGVAGLGFASRRKKKA